MRIITSELIEEGKSEKGGWTKFQLSLLGVQWPPQKGWKEIVIGRRIAIEHARQFLQKR